MIQNSLLDQIFEQGESNLSVKPRSILEPHFNGPAFDPKFDHERLTGQLGRIFKLMSDGKFRTLGEISAATHDPEGSVSAQLRHLRKERFGAHTVNRRARGDRVNGLFEYQLVISK